MKSQVLEKPIRVGVFDNIRSADRAVHNLLAAGFTSDQVTVVCSDEWKEKYFREFEHQDPAGTNTPAAVATGSAIGSALGGLTSLVGLVTLGGVSIMTAGLVLIPAGAVIGGFVGAMMTQGVEKELAYYYDQAVTEGKILVAAEDHSDRSVRMLAEAEHIFAAAGAKPIELPEG
jgi:hypothetical protein